MHPHFTPTLLRPHPLVAPHPARSLYPLHLLALLPTRSPSCHVLCVISHCHLTHLTLALVPHRHHPSRGCHVFASPNPHLTLCSGSASRCASPNLVSPRLAPTPRPYTSTPCLLSSCLVSRPRPRLSCSTPPAPCLSPTCVVSSHTTYYLLASCHVARPRARPRSLTCPAWHPAP